MKKNLWFVIELLLVLFVFYTLINQIFLKRYMNVFICGSTLIILGSIYFLCFKKKLFIPYIFRVLLALFIIMSGILGEVYYFYVKYPFYDVIVHIFNGFLSAGIGYSLINIWNKNSNYLSKSFKIIFIISFSLSVGVSWEFIEYSGDKFFKSDTQKDTLINSISSISLDESKNYKPVKISDIDKTVLYNQDNEVLITINGGYLDIGLNDTISDLLVSLIGSGAYLGLLFFKHNKNNYVIIKYKE